MKNYTVNVQGNAVEAAKRSNRHAYYSEYTNVTAIEIRAKDKAEARKIARKYGKVYYIFE